MNSVGWLGSFTQDLLYAFRGMRRSPVFTIVAVMTIALGIGVNASVFTLTNAVLFKGFPLVVRNEERQVEVFDVYEFNTRRRYALAR